MRITVQKYSLKCNNANGLRIYLKLILKKCSNVILCFLRVGLLLPKIYTMSYPNEERTSYSGTPITFDASTTTATYGLKEQRKRIKNWAKINLVGKTINLPLLGVDVTFTGSGIKEALNQPHKHVYHKNEAIKNIEAVILSAQFVKSESDYRGDTNYVYHYFKTMINNEVSFIVLREIKKEGKIIFYSIVDKLKK
jgi:Large polyvalent protein-associated domain 3